MKLETIGTFAFANGFKQLMPGSFQTSAELTTERRTDVELRDDFFYTANFGVYLVEDDQVVLYFGGREANPILKNIDEACRQLINTKNYRVSKKEMDAVLDSVESGYTLRVVLSDLDLQKYLNDRFRKFEVPTYNMDGNKDPAGYELFNESQRSLAERVYGTGDDFIENMEMLNHAGISLTEIVVLSPEYVIENTKNSPIARPGTWLLGFDKNSAFALGDSFVHMVLNLRGVKLVTLPESAMHDVLGRYLETDKLTEAKAELACHYVK
jgi:hypothetical protein